MASLTGFVLGAFLLSLAYQGMLHTLAPLALGLQPVTTSEMLRTAFADLASDPYPAVGGNSPRRDNQG
jgi:hypothetical protein